MTAYFGPYLRIFTLVGALDAQGGGGGGSQGMGHNLLMQLFTLGSSKIEVFETCFYDVVPA